MGTKKNRTQKIGERRKKSLSGPGKRPFTGLQAESENDGEEKPIDYGGLPDRDLKKNLGCG